jgi:hypothetical protein
MEVWFMMEFEEYIEAVSIIIRLQAVSVPSYSQNTTNYNTLAYV